MNTGNARTSRAPQTKQIENAEAELKSEAVAIEKLRVQLSAQGAAADKKQVAEFAKRQKAYLDRKIDFEKLKRSTESRAAEPTKAKPSVPELVKPAPEPMQRQKSESREPSPKRAATEKEVPKKAAPIIPEKAPFKESAKPKKPDTSQVKSPARTTEKSSAHWIWWLLLTAAAGLIAWLMR